MPSKHLYICLLGLLLLAGPAQAQSSREARPHVSEAPLYAQDGRGAPAPAALAGLSETNEVKLLASDLANQMFGSSAQGYDLSQSVSPGSFTAMSGGGSSDFGRYLGEMMLNELVRRHVPVKEYRGELKPARAPKGKGAKAQVPLAPSLVLAGNYYYDSRSLTVTARLVRGDGSLVKSAVVITPLTRTIRNMLGLYEESLSESTSFPRPVLLNIRDASESSRSPVPYTYTPKRHKKAAPKKAAQTKAEPKPKSEAKPDPGIELRVETTNVAPKLETTTVSPPEAKPRKTVAKTKE